MSNIDKRALRELATRATPGPWEEENGEVWIMRNGTANSILTSICGDDTSGQQDFDNARFISAANPATVLALLDELEARDKQNAELVAGRMNIQRTMGVYVHAYEEDKEQIAKDVEIKARLCRESNSLHDRLREAEKRIAEMEEKQVKIKLPESFYPDGDIECPLVINEYQIIEAIVAAGCKPIAVCPRCKCELDLTHKSDGAHYCPPAAAGKGE